MAKAKPERSFFYAGMVLNDNRPSTLFFDGIWIDETGNTFDQIREEIKAAQSQKYNGAKIALTALTILN